MQQSLSTDVRLWCCDDCSRYRRAACIEAIAVVLETIPAAITQRHSRPYREVFTTKGLYVASYTIGKVHQTMCLSLLVLACLCHSVSSPTTRGLALVTSCEISASPSDKLQSVRIDFWDSKLCAKGIVLSITYQHIFTFEDTLDDVFSMAQVFVSSFLYPSRPTS